MVAMLPFVSWSGEVIKGFFHFHLFIYQCSQKRVFRRWRILDSQQFNFWSAFPINMKQNKPVNLPGHLSINLNVHLCPSVFFSIYCGTKQLDMPRGPRLFLGPEEKSPACSSGVPRHTLRSHSEPATSGALWVMAVTSPWNLTCNWCNHHFFGVRSFENRAFPSCSYYFLGFHLNCRCFLCAWLLFPMKVLQVLQWLSDCEKSWGYVLHIAITCHHDHHA